jgi:hypothetical protein
MAIEFLDDHFLLEVGHEDGFIEVGRDDVV